MKNLSSLNPKCKMEYIARGSAGTKGDGGDVYWKTAKRKVKTPKAMMYVPRESSIIGHQQ
jgi:hypothetical protein